mmetsp:Transcript_35217/g.111296  ORF Transcript_35217/g.111296 Transcript_35217/m.111296 type:complete len:86 (+) Transcript_35217:570-827(+)
MGDSLAPWAGDELHVLSPEGRLTSYSIRAVAEQAPAKRAGSGRATTGEPNPKLPTLNPETIRRWRSRPRPSAPGAAVQKPSPRTL